MPEHFNSRPTLRLPRAKSLARAIACALTLTAGVANSASAGPPTLPPLMFQPFGFQQQLLPGQPQANFITPRPMAVMEPLFTLPAQPFGELGHNLTGSPTQSVPHRQPIAPDPLPGSNGGGGNGAAASGGPKFMPAPGFSRTPMHRRPLGW